MGVWTESSWLRIGTGGGQYQTPTCFGTVAFFFFSGGPPEYGTLVPKHVFDTCHELYFVICALLYFIECDNFYAVAINFTRLVHW